MDDSIGRWETIGYNGRFNPQFNGFLNGLPFESLDAEESQHFFDLCLNQQTFAGDSPI